MSRRKDPLTAAQGIFSKAAPEAAGLLVELLHSEDATLAQRLSCAESILSRALGKAGGPAGQGKEETGPLEVRFDPDARECAQ